MLNICGIIAFFMMYIYDLNLIYLGNKIFKKFFAIGSIILVFATLANIIIYFPKKNRCTLYYLFGTCITGSDRVNLYVIFCVKI